MIRSLFSGVSGLKAHQSRMDVIGNNIANVNTTGFKASRMTFADTLYQTMGTGSAPTGSRGGTNGKQVGLGVGVSTIDTLFTDASASQTGNNTDLALSGNGLFVVKEGGQTYYTRDGSFSFDEAGNYVLPGSGKFVQGWMADAEGKISPSAETENIQIQQGQSIAPKLTSKVTYQNNLDAALTSSKATNATITYTDGTTESVKEYTPTATKMSTVTIDEAPDNGTYTVPSTDVTTNILDKITVGGTDYYVRRNSAGQEKYTTGETLTNATVWSSEIASAKLVPGKNSSVTLAAQNGVVSVNSNNTLKLTGTVVTAGKYSVGGNYAFAAKTITAVKDNKDGTSTLTFNNTGDGITTVVVNGTDYAQKGTFTLNLAVTGVKADANDTITCKNGQTVTLGTGETANVGDAYEKKISGKVTAVQDHAAYDYKVKEWSSNVESATLTGTSSGSLTLGFDSKNTPSAMKINGKDATTLTLDASNGLAAGTYKPGDTCTITKTIDKAIDNTTDHTVTLVFKNVGADGITEVTVPNPSGKSYDPTANPTFNLVLSIKGVTAGTDDEITCANGESVTLTATKDDATVAVGSTYTKTASGYGTTAATESTAYSYNDKQVASMTLYDDNGTSATGDFSKSLFDQSVPGSQLTMFGVVDSEGGKTQLSILLTKTADNTWTPTFSNHSTTYTFTRDDGITGTATLNTKNIVFDTNGKYVSGTGSIDITYDNGLPGTQTVDLDYSKLTQYENQRTVHAEADGYEAGTLASVSIDNSGVITGSFSNGELRSLAQVAVAQFNNAAGLTRVGNNFYQVSNNSGTATVNTADQLNCTITPSSLEMSNVDLANEFSNMIITQRGYQSNSKMITVSDEMLETLINMKR